MRIIIGIPAVELIPDVATRDPEKAEIMETEPLLEQIEQLGSWLGLAVQDLSPEELRTVPSGFRNHILWNVGHLVVDNSDMLYRPAGIAPPHPDNFPQFYDAGTSPADWASSPDTDETLARAQSFAGRLREDFRAGKFAKFDPEKVVSGWKVHDFDETLAYVAVHTSIHLGVIMSIRKLIRPGGTSS